jgi:hypothetical protein
MFDYQKDTFSFLIHNFRLYLLFSNPVPSGVFPPASGPQTSCFYGTKYVAKKPLWEEQTSAGKIRLPQMGMAEPD